LEPAIVFLSIHFSPVGARKLGGTLPSRCDADLSFHSISLSTLCLTEIGSGLQKKWKNLSRRAGEAKAFGEGTRRATMVCVFI
jgi:hypothetical protein